MFLTSHRIHQATETKFGTTESLALIVLWVVTGMAVGAWGSVTDRLVFLLPCLLVGYLMLALLMRCDRRKLFSIAGFQTCALSALSIAMVFWSASSRVGLLGWSLVCLALQGFAINQERWELLRLARILFYFTLVALFLQLICDDYNTAVWSWMEAASEWFSSSITPLRLRGTASGFRILVLGLVLLAMFQALSRGANIWKVALSAFFLVVIYGLFVWSYRWAPPAWWHELLGPSVRLYSKIPSPNSSVTQLISMYDYVVVFGVLSVLPILYAARSQPPLSDVREWSIPFDPRRIWVSSLGILAMMACLHYSSSWNSAIAYKSGRLKIGLNCSWDKAKPAWRQDGPIGLKYAGMYGIFFDDLIKRGCEFVDIDETKLIEGSQLDGLDVVMMMVRTKGVEQIEVDALSQFVRDGGALILVTDHTNLDGCQDVFDRLAKPYGVTANFDSAFSHRKWWHQNLRCNRSLGMPEIESLNYGIGTGASLNVVGAARPLLVGKFAFGDVGNLFKSSRKEAFLGDYQYQHGEVLSDVILAAISEFGKGRVVCLGDSSLFQNTMYARSGRFVRHLLGWSAKQFSVGLLTTVWPAIACVLILTALPLIDWRVGCLVIAPAVCLAFGAIGERRWDSAFPWKEDVPTAICLDIAQSNINRDGFTESSYQSLPINLANAGFATEWIGSVHEAVAIKPSCMFLLAPSAPLRRVESKALLQYAEEGGHLIITVDRMYSPCVSQLLIASGISVLDQPLGGDLSDTKSGQVKCMNAWGLKLDAGRDSYVERLGTPVIASSALGRGRIVIVGDSGFFRDANLESEDNGSVLNLRFLHDLCSRIHQGANADVWKSPYRDSSIEEPPSP